LGFNIFEPVFDQLQMASTLPLCSRRKDVSSEPSVIASQLRSINDLPDEIILKIMSHFEPEDLCLNIAKVCERWNGLAKDVVLWKRLSYYCDESSDYSKIEEVRCTAVLGFRTNYLKNFAPTTVSNVQNLKEHFRN